MADSITTKKALANALKELMKNTPFTKITISDICNHCDMSRKSFYYHFKDKYDLVNWIFHHEYILPRQQSIDRDTIDMFAPEYLYEASLSFCRYLYENREFYSKVFKIKGQNCFSEYCREILSPAIEMRIQRHIDDAKLVNFCVDFYSDAALSAIERWIVDRNTMPPEEFVEYFLRCVNMIVDTDK